VTISAISSIAAHWFEGAMRSLDAMRTGYGAGMDDVPAATPSSVIYEGGLVRLRYYEARGTAHSTPILLVYSLIKRVFILDLQKGRSVVESLTNAGFDVYLIDWVPPRKGDKLRGFDAYVNSDIADAVRAVQIHSGVEKVTLLGYCFGALLAVMYAALHPRNVANLVTLTIPLDSSVREIPIEYMSGLMTPAAAEAIVAAFGNLPAASMNMFFNSLAPAHHLLDKFVGAHRQADRKGYLETFRLFEKWLHSDVPMTGKVFLETVEMTRNNLLVRGGMKIGGNAVNLRDIECPLLNVTGDFDDIVNPKSSLCLPDLVGSSDRMNLHFPTGHMGAAISSDSIRRLWPQISEWLAAHDRRD
jgi:polyhydroxyalkanoate synthase